MDGVVNFVRNHYLLLVLILLAPSALMAQEERKYIRKGTAEYEKGKFLESEIEYRRALDKDANSFEGNFNLGNALFKQEKVDESLEQYRNLAGTVTDKDQLSRIYHNIGNGHFAKQEYDKSIEAYKNALKNNPFDNETRYNLIVAQKMLQQQNQDKQNQDKQDQKDQQQDQKKDQEQQKQEQQQDQKDQQQQQKQQQQQQQNMSEKDAERLLNAIQQDENKLQEKMKKAKAAQKSAVEKNW